MPGIGVSAPGVSGGTNGVVPVLDRLAEFIQDPRVLNLIRQYLKPTVECGGLFWGFEKGIALGCPLSPVMGAFFLRSVDQALGNLGLFYV